MDCAICYEAITASTGKVDLSCSHSFHFSCLTSWFATQNGNEHTQSCPYCRHESNEHEKMLTTFIYPHNVQALPESEAEPIDMRVIAAATAAAERAAVAFLEARTAVNAFLHANSRLREIHQDNIQVEWDELPRTEESITQVATDIPRATQGHIEPRLLNM